jgi:hypothetical protein
MISLFKVFMSEDVIKPLNDVIMSGFITQGPKVEEFEKELTNFQISPSGYGIHWPDIDEDLSVEGLLSGAPAPIKEFSNA